MEGSGELVVYGEWDAVMEGFGDLVVLTEPEVDMAGVGEFYATADKLVIGEASLPFFVGHGFESIPAGAGSAFLPPIFQNSGEGGFLLPTPISMGFATLPSIGGSGVVTTIKGGGGNADLPFLTSIGGDFHYGVGYAELPFLNTFGMYGLSNYEAESIDYMLVGGSIITDMVLTVIFISEGTISDTVSLTRIQAVEFISQLEQSDFLTVLGTYDKSFIENLTVISRDSENVVTATGDVKADLNNEGMVWVVNTETGASGQYEQYGFNSFFTRPSDGKTYGICPNGIYRLEGDTDDGLDISALIDFGRSDYGTSHKKKIPYIYLGVGSDGALYLKVDCDGSTYIYEMRNNSTSIKNHRVNVGKGLHGNYWRPVVMNKDGSDFDLNAIQFEPIVSSRRIQ